jgi:hypothetical protein
MFMGSNRLTTFPAFFAFASETYATFSDLMMPGRPSDP